MIIADQRFQPVDYVAIDGTPDKLVARCKLCGHTRALCHPVSDEVITNCMLVHIDKHHTRKL